MSEDIQANFQEEIDPKSKMEDRSKEPLFQWDGKVNAGHLLTTITIVIAFWGLSFQKQILDNKVDALKVLVDSLELEKQTREFQITEEKANRLSDFNNNLEYANSQFVSSEEITSHEFILILSEINDLVNLSLAQPNLPQKTKRNLSVIRERNIARRETYVKGEIFHSKRKAFDAKYEPQKSNYTSMEEYLRAERMYNDTLSKNLAILLKELRDSTSANNKKVSQLEDQYLQLMSLQNR